MTTKSRTPASLPQPPPTCGKPSVCESCGAEFACGASLAACWCGEVKLGEATRAGLRARFRGCLCRACLERFEEGRGEARSSSSLE